MIRKPGGFRGCRDGRPHREMIFGDGDGLGGFWLVPFLLLRARRAGGASGDELAAELGGERQGEVRTEIREMEDAAHDRRYAITERGEAYLRSWLRGVSRCPGGAGRGAPGTRGIVFVLAGGGLGTGYSSLSYLKRFRPIS